MQIIMMILQDVIQLRYYFFILFFYFLKKNNILQCMRWFYFSQHIFLAFLAIFICIFLRNCVKNTVFGIFCFFYIFCNFFSVLSCKKPILHLFFFFCSCVSVCFFATWIVHHIVCLFVCFVVMCYFLCFEFFYRLTAVVVEEVVQQNVLLLEHLLQ